MKRFTKILFSFALIGLLLSLNNNLTGQVSYSLNTNCAAGAVEVWFNPGATFGATTDWNPCKFTLEVPFGQSGVLGTVTNFNGFSWAPQNGGSLWNSDYQVYTHAAVNQIALTSGTPVKVAEIALTGAGGIFLAYVRIPADTNSWVGGANGGLSVITANPPGTNQIPPPYAAQTLTNVPAFAGIIWDGVAWCGGSQGNGEPGAADGASNCYVNGPGGTITYFNGVVNQLNILAGASLTIGPGFALTANGPTDIEDPSGLIIAADPTGSGSFIDNGTVTYGTVGPAGSADVQTYMDNTLGAGTFSMHQIGPTVIDPTFSASFPGETGVFLGAFNFTPGSTYAYRYREDLNSWENIVPTTFDVPTASGIDASNLSGVSTTLTMTGDLAVGTINSTALVPWALSYTPAYGAGTNMLSNPYASGLNLDNWYTDNSTFSANLAGILGTTVYVWDHAAGNYSTWTCSPPWIGPGTGTGSMIGTGGNINPGQGFFITLSAAPINPAIFQYFALPPVTYPIRQHYHGPLLKSEQSNMLRLKAEGNMTNNDLIIWFNEQGTVNGTDTLDAEKWPSAYVEATELWTVAEDQIILTVNNLPPLGTEMVTVPMSFKCGASEQYTISASEIGSFEAGTEIYLEDLLLGDPWQLLNTDPVYTFDATPDDDQERFLVHFFGATGIEDDLTGAQSDVKIYSSKEYAYILNKGDQVLTEYIVYDILGNEVKTGSLDNSDLNRIYIGGINAYYVIKAIGDNSIFTGTVFINQ